MKSRQPIKTPELLAPAGNLEKLNIAFHYGADACFVGGTVFGLRKFADNFDNTDLKKAVALANTLNKKVYVVLNGFAHNEDLDALKHHLDELETIRPHAFIISDIGVMQLAKKHTQIDCHTSTQASVTNRWGCEYWMAAGAKRIILAREVSIEDCKKIKEDLDIELEIFIHGAMCASYSGKCVISNYTAGRDSNRGGCIQSCRHTYEVMDSANEHIDFTSHIMNAKDLMGVQQIPSCFEAGIDSLKIEGRMKSNLYAANTVSVYRAALDYYAEHHNIQHSTYETELSKVSNRTFSSGGLDSIPSGPSIHYDFAGYTKGVDLIGTIKAVNTDKNLAIAEIRVPFEVNTALECMLSNGERITFTPQSLQNMAGAHIDQAKQNTLVQFKLPSDKCQVYDVIRRPI